jgi:hypothetical protein
MLPAVTNWVGHMHVTLTLPRMPSCIAQYTCLLPLLAPDSFASPGCSRCVRTLCFTSIVFQQASPADLPAVLTQVCVFMV